MHWKFIHIYRDVTIHDVLNVLCDYNNINILVYIKRYNDRQYFHVVCKLVLEVIYLDWKMGPPITILSCIFLVWISLYEGRYFFYYRKYSTKNLSNSKGKSNHFLFCTIEINNTEKVHLLDEHKLDVKFEVGQDDDFLYYNRLIGK